LWDEVRLEEIQMTDENIIRLPASQPDHTVTDDDQPVREGDQQRATSGDQGSDQQEPNPLMRDGPDAPDAADIEDPTEQL
jgi:hypothetical protein